MPSALLANTPLLATALPCQRPSLLTAIRADGSRWYTRGLNAKTRFDAALDELGEAFAESKLSAVKDAVEDLKGKARAEVMGNMAAEKAQISARLEGALRSRVESGNARLVSQLKTDKTVARAVEVRRSPLASY